MHVNLLEYLSEKRLPNPKQFGFRLNNSCETALICMVDELVINVDKGVVNGLAVIDLRKAFDMTDYRILVSKLTKYGCSDKFLTWFRFYLNDRKESVSMQNKKSNIMTVFTGVVKDSILGPLLFTVMINDLPSHIGKGNVYMNTTTISLYGNSPTDIEIQLNNVLQEINKWVDRNKLIPNREKTKVMSIG